jgi:hypothetical protein
MSLLNSEQTAIPGTAESANLKKEAEDILSDEFQGAD